MPCKIIINVKHIKNILVYIIIQLFSIYSENCSIDVSSFFIQFYLSYSSHMCENSSHMCEKNIEDIRLSVHVYMRMGVYITLFAYVCA